MLLACLGAVRGDIADGCRIGHSCPPDRPAVHRTTMQLNGPSMTQSPRVSVIMSVFDREEFYQRSIGSILAQDFKDFEFIIVDDGSRQPAVDAIESFGDPRIRLVRLPVNSGIAMARNIGMKMARG